MIKLKNKKDFKKLKPNDYSLKIHDNETINVFKIRKTPTEYFYITDHDFGLPIKDNLDFAKSNKYFFAKATKKDMPDIIAFYLTN